MPRNIGPERRAVPLQEWPVLDQRAWIAATAAGDVFDGQGRGAHWAPTTKATNLRHYGRWLGFLAFKDMLNPGQEPADRVTKDSVQAYDKHLRTLVAPRTRLGMLVGLKEVIRAMAPDRCWPWLQDVCNHVQRNAPASRDKRQRILSSVKMYRTARSELRRLQTQSMTINNAIRYRDLLMLALFSCRPIRKANLASIKLGRHLDRKGPNWWLRFRPEEVKNREPIDFELPQSLIPLVDHYLNQVRPMFPQAATSRALWLCKSGPNVDPHFPYWRVTKLTMQLFGKPINPHLFRDCAATELAMNSPASVQASKGLLGHRQLSTTERYYVQANDLEASRQLNTLLAKIKKSAKGRSS